MDRIQSFKSIRERKQKVLGIYSFSEPIVPEKRRVAAASTERNSRAQQKVQTKRDKSVQNQRAHRQRTRDYILALEAEVESLRNGETRLNQISNDWKRTTVALIGRSKRSPLSNPWITQIGAGIFVWTISDDSDETELSSRHSLWLLLSPESALRSSVAVVPPSMEVYDATVRELLLNFCENITPSLDVTEAVSHGYAKHIIPLTIESDIVRNAVLAASASQRGAHRGMKYKSLVYRSAAIRGLQKTSQELQKYPKSAIFTLAALLGLLIDDMINENEEFPALVKLADSCIAFYPFGNESDAELRRFLMDQIQMIKALVHPLYKFSQGYNPSTKSFGSTDILFPRSSSKMSDIFTHIESATAQACSIYNRSPLSSSNPSSEMDGLLDTLNSTTDNIPPYAPGENSLVWVYSVAVSRSSKPEHCAFFTSRLVELLQRIGHQDVSGYLAGLSIS